MIRIGPQPAEERTTDYEYKGFKFKIIAEDPYGFYKIFCIKTRKYLDGRYTEQKPARIAIAYYVNNVLLKKKEDAKTSRNKDTE